MLGDDDVVEDEVGTVGGHTGGIGGQVFIVGKELVIVGGLRVDRKVGKVGRGEISVTVIIGGSEVTVGTGNVLVSIGNVKVAVGISDEIKVDVKGGYVKVWVVNGGNVNVLSDTGTVVLVNGGGVFV